MSKKFKTPGIYVREINLPTPSITRVPTSIVAFVGYTEKAGNSTTSFLNQPKLITSFLEFEQNFGTAFVPKFTMDNASVPASDTFLIGTQLKKINAYPSQLFFLHTAVRLFFENGGSKCFIVSVGGYTQIRNKITIHDELVGAVVDHNGIPLQGGLKALEHEDTSSILLIPDAVALEDDAYSIYQEMLNHCAQVGNRFAILDIPGGAHPRSQGIDCITHFRENIGTQNLKNAAVYYPWLVTRNFQEASFLHLNDDIDLKQVLPEDGIQPIIDSETSTFEKHRALKTISPTYWEICKIIQKKINLQPPSGAIAGLFALTDANRGVWKAPANISISGVTQLSVAISSLDQRSLNVDPLTGKSINAIRFFPGKGILVWGARTLAGNDYDWRYLNIRRTMLMIEKSIMSGLKEFESYENEPATWIRIKQLTENFLLQLWRDGALAGSRAEHSFFIRVGLNETMTSEDLNQDILILELGIAMSKPAEFIIERITIKMTG